MALPKLNTAPNYEMVIPSTGKTVRYRPFLVKEQKAMMIAAESNDNKVMFRSILDVLLQCIDDKVYRNQLTSFDVEYMFLQMRSKSVGESSDVRIKCSECNEFNDVNINMEQITVDVEKTSEKIKLTDDITVELNYPSFNDMIDSGIGDGELTSDQMFSVLHSCIKSVETPDERIDMKDVPKKEVEEFIESMSSDQFEKINKFVADIPRLSHPVEFTCTHCSHENKITLEGMQAFLS